MSGCVSSLVVCDDDYDDYDIGSSLRVNVLSPKGAPETLVRFIRRMCHKFFGEINRQALK